MKTSRPNCNSADLVVNVGRRAQILTDLLIPAWFDPLQQLNDNPWLFFDVGQLTINELLT